MPARTTRRPFPWLLVLVPFLTLAWSATLAGPADQESSLPVPNPDPVRFEKQIAEFEAWERKNSPATDATLFVGSSSIRGWETAAAFPRMPVINRGFGGSHISDVNHFADRIVLPHKAKVIVFYAGDNDIASGKPPEQVAADYRTFVERVRRSAPRTPIIFISIKPSTSRWQHWPRMQEANALIRELCSGDQTLVYADVAGPMLGDDGRPREDLFLADNLHLNAAGYEVWKSVLEPLLAGPMGS